MAFQLLFWLSFTVLLFTYGGYPLLLVLLAPHRPKPVIRSGPWEPSLSIVIAARNEAAHIEAKLRNCAQLEYPAEQIEIILVDDASEDDTVARARRCGIGRLRIVSQKRRLGKWAAINRGVLEATGDVLVFTDADSLIQPDSLRWLARPFVNPIVGCVAGQYLPGGVRGQNAAAVGLYWKYENFIRVKESELGGLLGASGSLYALRSELFEPLKAGLINDDFIIPMLAAQKGYRTLYEPRAVSVEDESRNAEVEFGRRVRIMAGNCQHLWMFRHLLWKAPFSRVGFQLFCHKFLRVLSPLWMVGALAGGAALQERLLYCVLLCLQIAFYGAAAIGYLLRPRHRLGFVVNLPRYFLMINLAALMGIYYFVFRHAEVPWNLGRAETAPFGGPPAAAPLGATVGDRNR
jgi:cellulose synthase/poly-beta-1,6-N-acetylglucosamine synthase-like glycosyltransferase